VVLCGFGKELERNGWFFFILIFQLPGAGSSLIFDFLFFKYLEHDGFFIPIFLSNTQNRWFFKMSNARPISWNSRKEN